MNVSCFHFRIKSNRSSNAIGNLAGTYLRVTPDKPPYPLATHDSANSGLQGTKLNGWRVAPHPPPERPPNPGSMLHKTVAMLSVSSRPPGQDPLPELFGFTMEEKGWGRWQWKGTGKVSNNGRM
jgi:hypothetical protein